MLRKLIDPSAVEKAIDEFDQIGRERFLRKYDFGRSRDYFVHHNGKLYDSKAIVGAAFGYAFPEQGPLAFGRFRGGDVSVVKKLEGLGFNVSRVAHSAEHYLLKLNRDQVPKTANRREWESREFNIEPVRLRRAGHLIDPLPPPTVPGSEVAVWVNDDGGLGGIVATAKIADVTRAGSRCQLKRVVFCEKLGLAELSRYQSGPVQELYRDVHANQRSKVRHLSLAQWSALETLILGERTNSAQTTLVGKIARSLNERAQEFGISSLQEIRSRIHRKRLTGSVIFSAKSIKETYAFHSGGREELQFNIGEEAVGERRRFRWGVAFSFEPSRSFPNPGVLARKVRFFNDYISLFGNNFADMKMWKYSDGAGPTDMGSPQPIDASLVRNNVFVFLGKHIRRDRIDLNEILCDFDRLLPLYEYVESEAMVVPERAELPAFVFRAGHKAKARKATASIVARELELDFRHEAIEIALHARLKKEHGVKLAGTEQTCPSGMRIDAMVKHATGYWLYEVKTSSSPRMCLREAIGQLLEYCLWPGGVLAERLIVVGESPLDPDGRSYLAALNAKLSIPIEYLAVKAVET